MDVKHFITSLANGQNAEAKGILDDILGAKAFEAIENRKIELAQSIFGNENRDIGNEQETPETEETDEI
jgi:hypothetical protein